MWSTGKPAVSYNGVTYAAMAVGDGITIRAHNGPGAVLIGTLPCLPNTINASNSVLQNYSFAAGTAAPTTWRDQMFAEQPWMEDFVDDPASLTGGLGGVAPWTLASQLTRGDAATPNTGPNRNSPGGQL